MQKLSFAVIGAGPAGFYISKCLAKLPQEPIIHIYEKEYCPFGLIRYGVAPDHITIKKSENTLSSIANYPAFRYFGNTHVHSQLLTQLRQQYSGIVYALGAQKDNVPGWITRHHNYSTHSKRVLNSRQIVYWYNNHPDFQDFSLDLSKTRDVVIIGNGNVAIDIARILLKPVSALYQTQISPNALASLQNSQATNVMLVARRGFTHSAFSLKELRELEGTRVRIYSIEEQLQRSMNEASHFECTYLGNNNNHTVTIRMNKRKADFIRDKCTIIKKADLASLLQTKQKKVILRFLLDPTALQDGSLTFNLTELQGQPFNQTAVRTDAQEVINYDLLVNSTGFKVQAIEPKEQDDKKNCISNSDGCVVTKGRVEIGEYAVGWCKSGPRGVLDQTLLSCEQTFNNIRIHINNEVIVAKKADFPEQSKVNFQRYLELKEFQLSRGDKQKFIKKKLSHREVVAFFEK